MEEYSIEYCKEEVGVYNYTDIEVKTINTVDYLDERQRKASQAGEFMQEEQPNYFNLQREDTEIVRYVDVIKTDKYKYIGEIANSKRDGFGVCYYNRGETYIGNWVSDKKEGLGKTIFTNGDINQ